MTTHIAWDRGAVTEDAAAMLAIEFGVYVTQKTCKTQCHKRVKMAQIENEAADCPACRATVVAFARDERAAFLSFVDTLDGTDRAQVEKAIAHCEDTMRRFA